jgi:hypothetical protein
MFVREFFFSFSLLAFAALLMVGGIALLVDALRRLAKDVFSELRQARVAVKPVVPVQPKKITTFEQAA